MTGTSLTENWQTQCIDAVISLFHACLRFYNPAAIPLQLESRLQDRTRRKTWEAARAVCGQKGGDLAGPVDESVHNFLIQEIAKKEDTKVSGSLHLRDAEMRNLCPRSPTTGWA